MNQTLSRAPALRQSPGSQDATGSQSAVSALPQSWLSQNQCLRAHGGAACFPGLGFLIHE